MNLQEVVHNNCVHKGAERLPSYREGYCYETDECFCIDCGWVADLNAYHKDVCKEPVSCIGLGDR